MSSYEKSVKGGTKIKLAAPKSKYVEHILQATHSGEAGVAEIFRTLTFRLRDSTWTIVFKALIIIHLMVREGAPQATLRYIAESPSKMAISQFTDAQVQGPNIRHYHNYLLARAKAYAGTKLDWVRDGQGRLNRQTIDKGLLRETESVQKQLSPLLRCDLFGNESENEISLTAFRLLVIDLLALFKVMNEGMVNILEHYFEMSKPDAERALNIYQTFIKQTDQVVKYLHIARQFENATRLEIPSLKHAPTTLLSPLQEYLNDPDFEINRRQYLAQRDGKKVSSKAETSSKPTPAKSAPSASTSQPSQLPQVAPKGPAPDLIDFFESIEQNQQQMPTQVQQNGNPFQIAQQPGYQAHVQQSGFPATNPFAQMVAQEQQSQTQGFGVNTPQVFAPNQLQAIPQDQQASFLPQQPFQNGQQPQPPQQPPFQNATQHQFNAPQSALITGQQQYSAATHSQQPAFAGQQFGQQQSSPTGQQSTNPFRQSMMPSATGSTSSPFSSSPFNSAPPQPQNSLSTNPFARNVSAEPSGTNISPFYSAPSGTANSVYTQQQFQPLPAQSNSPIQPLQSSKTGTNPFARSPPNATITSPIVPQTTGTNPFRQSTFVNQQTGHSWQAHQGTLGGLEQLNTIPVFPRPAGQPQQPQQQQWQ